MKLIIRLGVTFLILVLTFPSFTQTFDAIDTGNGVVNFILEQPPLKAKTKAVPVTPFYKHTILFGDGTFRFLASGEKAQVIHTYGPPFSSGIIHYLARAYSSGVYNEDEEDVPDMKAPPIVPPVSGNYPAIEVVDSNRYIKIMRHVEVKPGDVFINVLSIKNPDTSTFNGQLFFFYNGRLSAVRKGKKQVLPDYSIFNISEKLFYRPDVGSMRTLAYSTLPASLKTKYEKMLLMEIFNLAPGEEVHYFMEMEGDAAMMDLFDATVKAEMDFGLALGSFSDNVSFLVPDSLQNELTSLKINSFIASIGGEGGQQPDDATIFNPHADSSSVSDFTFLQSSASIIVDYYTSTASLVKSHDPNYMIMEACDCPEIADIYQVFTTIRCENNGYGETSNIYIDVKLPNGITADDIALTPIAYHPFVGPADQISMKILAPDSIRWELLNFGLEGTPIHGVGDPRTYAEVQFNMYSRIDPALLDSVHACIRFDLLSNDPVCTIPVAVSLVGAELTEGILSCTQGDCDDYPSPCCLPSWCIWLCVAVGLIIILLLLFGRKIWPRDH